MPKDRRVAPVLKWAGGKRQLLPTLRSLLPQEIDVYCEPFVGGGALFFDLQPKMAFINDVNEDLIRCYAVIRSDPEALIAALRQFKNREDDYYAVRNWDRDKQKYAALSDVEKAARILYLNKTCYNGLFRVNRAGEFNAPFGNYRNPGIVNATVIRAVSAYFNVAHIRLSSTDYHEVLNALPEGAFVYLDPPYDPVSASANFTGYSRDGFTRADQLSLRSACDSLTARGVRFMLSNSATPFILQQYATYAITIVHARRAINADPAKRGEIAEVVVRNYS